ncbi:MAG: TonB-dependent receptor [Tannerellaceae bacterium]|jgi:TonB-linked SusC/RagA family outer membrane protein|nr:TonB-dependent receptor [Tannerellaceae bacterium]
MMKKLTFLFLCLLASVGLASAQNTQVTGVVISAEDGEPVIGANVMEKGTTNGVITNVDGEFELSIAPQATIVVSYIGYETQEVKVGTSSTLRVVLAESRELLDEVVVVGFGVQKKANLTGAVSVVGDEELAQRPVTSAAQALQGLVPGLQISSSSGTLDSTPEINVRGVGTIGEGSNGAPLILIDGVEGDINTLTTQDIESISILKDAAASSIYGSRAPFGVILITTKAGTNDGRVSINYNNSFRFINMINEKHMMNSVDFSSWMNDAQTNSGNTVFFNEARMERIMAYHNGTEIGPGTRETSLGTLYAIDADANGNWLDGYANGIDDVDWYDAIYRSSTFAQEHNASVSGGNEKLNYYASFNYIGNRGFMKLAEDTYSRYNASAKIGIQLSGWARMNYSMRYIRNNYKRPSYLKDDLYTNLTRQGWPILPLYDRNGYYVFSPSWALPLATRGDDRSEKDMTNHQIGFVFEPVKNWITHVDLNYRVDSRMNHWDVLYGYNHDIEGNPAIINQESEVHEALTKDQYMNFQAYTAYSLSLNEMHNFHVMAGFQAEQLKRTEFGLTRAGIIDPNKPEVDLTNGLSYNGSPIVPNVNGKRNQWQTAGFFGRINYNFMERYLFEANLRYDGTSRFRTDNMWKLFPSFSFGWRVNEENFLNEIDWISNLKFRLSYGSLGNQNTNNWYQTYQTVSYNSNAGNWLQEGAKSNTTAAPGLVSTLLTWEKIESYNVGLDFGFMNNKLWGSLDYFIRDTKNMVGNAPELPSILGTNVPVTNNTDLSTSGWEFQIGWRDQLSNGLSYGATFNLSDARTKITRYPNNPTGDLGRFIVGRYTNDIWGYETIGIAKSQEEMDAHLANVDQSYLGSNWSAGDIMYADLNEDGRIGQGANTLTDHGDKKVLGNSTPRFHLGIDLNASWKGFDVRMFFQGLMKHDISTGGASQWLFGSTSGNMWEACGLTVVQDYYRDENTWSVTNGYREANQDAWLPRVYLGNKNTQTQSRYILNAAYMRLKNFQIGYTIPQSIVSKLGVRNIRAFFSGENLFTFTTLPEQFDPETVGNNAGRNNGYPLSKTYSFGLNVQF